MFAPVSIDEVQLPFLVEAGVRLLVKRDDLLHPYVSGNKLYKLKYNIEAALQHIVPTLLTFGGAMSNHLVATAAYCNSIGMPCIGVVRGDEVEDYEAFPALNFCKQQGMHLHFVSRTEYKDKHTEGFLNHLNQLYNNPYLVPEGGANALGVKGAAEMLNPETIAKVGDGPVTLLVACGTGTTLAGVVKAMPAHWQALGISVLKGDDTLTPTVESYLTQDEKAKNWQVLTQHHCGGYAKTTPELQQFKEWFTQQTAIRTDVVYTAKLFFAIQQLAQQGAFTPHTTLLALHTGGYSFSK